MPVLLNNAAQGRKDRVKGAPVRTPKAAEMQYFRRLNELTNRLKDRTGLITQLVRTDVPRAAVIEQVSRQIEQAEREFNAAADAAVEAWAGNVSTQTKRRIENTLKRALGADTATILEGTATREALDLAMAENVALIRTIPQEHFTRVSRSILAAYRGETFAEGSLTNRLAKIGNITKRRAQFIARDQTSDLVSDLNQIRQQEVGIEGYLWRNSQDIRVVGRPGGTYPTGNRRHMDHWTREGKFYRWDDPPSDGHPGKPINCRCFAEPVIERSKLNAVHV